MSKVTCAIYLQLNVRGPGPDGPQDDVCVLSPTQFAIVVQGRARAYIVVTHTYTCKLAVYPRDRRTKKGRADVRYRDTCC